jgi:hypothetical protein
MSRLHILVAGLAAVLAGLGTVRALAQGIPCESYRRFSYEPAAIAPGDAAVVRGENVKVMKGAEVVGTAPQGLTFKVTKVTDGWLGAVVEVEGRKLSGWIWSGNVAVEGKSSAPPRTAVIPEAGREAIRRYSFEPTTPTLTPAPAAPSYRSAAPSYPSYPSAAPSYRPSRPAYRSAGSRPSYLYPKTDSRRYGR